MKWWIAIISLVVLLAGGGTAAFLLMADGNNQPDEQDTSSSEEGSEATAENAVKPAIYQAIEPPIIVNFRQAAGAARYLQVGIEIMSRDQRVLDVIEQNMPAIRNNLILLLSDQDTETLHTREGKNALREAVRHNIEQVVHQEAPALAPTHQAGSGGDEGDGADATAAVEAVYFTKFVMQ